MILLTKTFNTLEPSYYLSTRLSQYGIEFELHGVHIPNPSMYRHSITFYRDELYPFYQQSDQHSIILPYNKLDFRILLEIFEQCHCQTT